MNIAERPTDIRAGRYAVPGVSSLTGPEGSRTAGSQCAEEAQHCWCRLMPKWPSQYRERFGQQIGVLMGADRQKLMLRSEDSHSIPAVIVLAKPRGSVRHE